MGVKYDQNNNIMLFNPGLINILKEKNKFSKRSHAIRYLPETWYYTHTHTAETVENSFFLDLNIIFVFIYYFFFLCVIFRSVLHAVFVPTLHYIII